MCLAIPGKVLEIQADAQGVRMGKTNFGGIVKQVCLEYTPDVKCGDYVLVHVGFALGKVDDAEAERTYRALEELNQLGELETPTEPEATGVGTARPQAASEAASSGDEPSPPLS
jgi:hydrogenase expression/formation protein HypC